MNSEQNPTKVKAPSKKEASAKPRDENKDHMPRSGPSPKTFGMNTMTAKLPADEICVQLLRFRKMLGQTFPATHGTQHQASST